MADIKDIKIGSAKYNIKLPSDRVNSMADYTKPSSAPATPAIQQSDTLNQAVGKLEYKADVNQTNILSVEDMICDTEFSTSTAYAVGDIVTYEHGLYKFNTAHSAGDWNSAEVDEVSAVDLISSGSGTDSVASKEIYVTKPINQPDTWETKTWSGLTPTYGQAIWADGTDIYYSAGANQYVLNKGTSTWETKTWSGLTSFDGYAIWTDGTNIYYSYGSTQYVLNKGTSTWETKTWDGLTSFMGNKIWTDGENIYCSDESPEPRPYVLDKATSTWETKTWDGLTDLYGQAIWSDGTDIYYSAGSNQYVLDKSASTWSARTWIGLTSFSGTYIWSDGESIYYSYQSDQYVLKRPLKTTKIPDVKNNAQLTALIGNINTVLEGVL